MDHETLDTVVQNQIVLVGHCYGRRTMQGLLSSRLGIRINRTRVGQSLVRVAPDAHLLRTKTRYKEMNPVLYTAAYFGEQLHCDQNEKLVNLEVTLVMAIDGYSRKVVAFITIPVKNAVSINKHLFRPLLISNVFFLTKLELIMAENLILCLLCKRASVH